MPPRVDGDSTPVERTDAAAAPPAPIGQFLLDPKPQRLDEEQLAWARSLYTEADYLEGLRDIQENGGYRFADLLQALEPAARGDE